MVRWCWLLALVSLVAAACGGDSAGSCDADAVDDVRVGVGAGEVFTRQAVPVDPSSQTVVFLHGASFTSSVWCETGLLETVAAEGDRAVAVDLPGFGETAESSLRPSEFMAALSVALDAPPESMVLVAPSMSGEFAFRWLEADPPVALGGLVAVAPVGIGRFFGRTELAAVPTLIAWGENDDVIPVGQAQVLADKMPGSEVVTFAGGGHAPYRTNTEEFTKKLLEFIEATREPAS